MGVSLILTDETCIEITRQTLKSSYITWSHDPETKKKALDALLLVIGAFSTEGQWYEFMRELDNADIQQ